MTVKPSRSTTVTMPLRAGSVEQGRCVFAFTGTVRGGSGLYDVGMGDTLLETFEHDDIATGTTIRPVVYLD